MNEIFESVVNMPLKRRIPSKDIKLDWFFSQFFKILSHRLGKGRSFKWEQNPLILKRKKKLITAIFWWTCVQGPCTQIPFLDNSHQLIYEYVNDHVQLVRCMKNTFMHRGFISFPASYFMCRYELPSPWSLSSNDISPIFF